MSAALRKDCITLGIVSGPFGKSNLYGPAAFAATTIPTVRQFPEQCASCRRQITTLEVCVLPDGTQKRGANVTFRESAEGGIRCTECAPQHPPQP